MTDTLTGMMSYEEFLEHAGVKGMKWGVTREKAAAGSKKAVKQLAKADRKWEKELNSTTGFIKVNNAMADKMNGPNGEIAKLNNKPEYRNAEFSQPSPLREKYYAEYGKIHSRTFDEAAMSLYGDSPSGKYTINIDHDAGTVTVKPKDEIAHAYSDGALIFNFKKNASGLIEELLPASEDKLKHSVQKGIKMSDAQLSGMMSEEEFFEHAGVKGMKWGQRKAEQRSMNKASKIADRAKNDAAIDAARDRYKTSARSNYKTAKAQYKTDKLEIGRREAKKAFDAVKQQNIDDYQLGSRAKSGRETTTAVLTAVGGMLLMGAVKIAAKNA